MIFPSLLPPPIPSKHDFTWRPYTWVEAGGGEERTGPEEVEQSPPGTHRSTYNVGNDEWFIRPKNAWGF